VGEEERALAPVWARSGEQIAMAATKKRIRVIAELFRRSTGRRRKDFIQQRLLLTVYFVFGQRDRVFRRLIGAALTFKLSADSL